MNDITYVGRFSLVQTVTRHAHESWEFVYCTYGEGTFLFDDGTLAYREGDVVAIPPMVPHANTSAAGSRNIHINMSEPMLTMRLPTLITDDANRFLLDAFKAAYFHFYSDRKERTALLASYGNLISCYLSAYQTTRHQPNVVEDIERSINSHCCDCDFELDTYLRSLPFSYDYLRKLFQKQLGVTPHQYLSERRLQLAAEALLNRGLNGSAVSDVAAMCGFHDPLYFSKIFKKKYGVAPSFYNPEQPAPV